MDALRRLVVQILTWEARLVLARYKPNVIAITGSVGKTTTKDAIFAALSPHVYVRKSEKSFNSEFGVPLTILGSESGWSNPFAWAWILVKGLLILIVPQQYPRFLILEVGADRPGDIKKIARWLRPDTVVITPVPEVPVHVEFFSSPEEVLKEKRSLAEHIKHGGKIVLNGDDPRVRTIHDDFRGACVTFGFERYNDFSASHAEILYQREMPLGMRFRVEHVGSSAPISIFGALGNSHMYAALAALAVAEIIGLDLVSAGNSLADWIPSAGRMRLLEGVNGSIILDDTYNSSPAAAIAALDTLRAVRAARKIAIMGDMLELGKYSAEQHREVGKRVAEVADLLITVGFRARGIAEAAFNNGMGEESIRQYDQDDAARVGKELKKELQQGDIVLVKGSQSIRMERTVRELMAEPERAAEFLVRQDAEWKNR